MHTVIRIALFTILFITAGRPVTAGAVRVTLDTTHAPIATIRYTGQNSISVYADAFQVNGHLAYCVDLQHDNTADQTYTVVSSNLAVHSFADSAYTDAGNRMAWLLNHAVGIGPAGREAIQLTLWHLADRNFSVISGLTVDYNAFFYQYDPTIIGTATLLSAQHDGTRYQDLAATVFPTPEPPSWMGCVVACLVSRFALARRLQSNSGRVTIQDGTIDHPSRVLAIDWRHADV